MRDLLGCRRIQMHIGQQVGIGFVLKKSGEHSRLLIAEAVVRHHCAGIVNAGIANPGLQPVRLYLAAHAGQFGP